MLLAKVKYGGGSIIGSIIPVATTTPFLSLSRVLSHRSSSSHAQRQYHRPRFGGGDTLNRSETRRLWKLGDDNGEAAELVDDGGAEAVSSSPVRATSSRQSPSS